METYTTTLTKEEMIECAEALYNQAYHMRKQFIKTQKDAFNDRAYLDFRIADKIINQMHMVYIYQEQLKREADSD